MKFTATTTAILDPFFGAETEIDLVITAQYSKGYAGSFMEPAEPASVEILRVEVRDRKHRTLHLLPEYLVDVLTDNDETRDYLLSEAANEITCRRDDAADMRRDDFLSSLKVAAE